MKTQRTQRKRTVRWLSTLLLFGVAITLMFPAGAWAALTDTDAGDSITNQASIVYSVGTVQQNPVNSTVATFVVDHKVRPLAAMSADDTAIPGGTDEYLTFTVTNDGNTDSDGPDTLEIQLTAQQGLNGSEDVFDVIASSIRIYEDDGSGALDGADTLVTDYSGPSLGTINLARDTSATIFVVANMPLTPINTHTALVHLIATAWDSSGPGAPLAEDGDGDDPAAVEVVWADGAGSLPAGADGTFDGFHSASAVFTIATADLTVTKDSSVVSSIYGPGSLYRLPGNTVRYTITIDNNGPADATNLQVVDQIPTGTDMVVGSEGPVAGIASVDYADDDPPTWGYAPAAGRDANVTWVRINLSGTAAASGGSESTYFDVIIE